MKKSKYNLGGNLAKAGFQVGLNAIAPGLGSAASMVLNPLIDNEVANIQFGKEMTRHFKNVEETNNPYQLMKYGAYLKKTKNKLMLGGHIKGLEDAFKYKGKSHSNGGINVNDNGIPVIDSNKEVEGEETTVKLKDGKYVFSKLLKVK